jgi:4'-phosphopantetheinyl transferase
MADTQPFWLPPPADLRLADDDVHLWRASLDQPEPGVRQLVGTLCDDERARAERYRFEQDRRRYIVAHGALRAILGRYLGLPPHQVQFSYGPHGKPYLSQGSSRSPLQFNLSDSHELALYAFTRGRRIGVDLEHVRPMPDADQIAARFFSPRENAAWQALPPDQRQGAFFRCWTRKEAYVKALGEGLAQPLDEFDVTLAPGEPARLLHVEGDPQAAARWTLTTLVPAPGYAAALAVEGIDWRLSLWEWRSSP